MNAQSESKPRLLDLFCGAGGCTKGYQRAGFYVVGVDIEPHPDYCGDEFRLNDAVAELEAWVDRIENGPGGFVPDDFDAVHASPPCQRYSHMGQRYADTQAEHPDLIGPIRDLLRRTGMPYVIENVMGARDEMPDATRLCGSSFGLGVHRHRLFETNFPVMALPCAHNGTAIEGLPVYGKLDGRRIWTRADGSELRAPKTLKEAQEAMGIDWMQWDDLKEAIPPAYTEHIGHYLMAEVNGRQEALAA